MKPKGVLPRLRDTQGSVVMGKGEGPFHQDGLTEAKESNNADSVGAYQGHERGCPLTLGVHVSVFPNYTALRVTSKW